MRLRLFPALLLGAAACAAAVAAVASALRGPGPRGAAAPDPAVEELRRRLARALDEQQRQGRLLRSLVAARPAAAAGHTPAPSDAGAKQRQAAEAEARRAAEENAQAQARVQEEKADTDNETPQPGVDYLTDYDVSTIEEPPEYRMPSTSPPFFYPKAQNGMPRFFLLSHRPKAFYFPRFMSGPEADEIRTAAERHMARSHVTPLRGANDAGQVSQVRTSDGAWLDDDIPAVRAVRDRVTALTGFSRSPGQGPGQAFNGQFEKLQILRYTRGQKYDHHSDFFEPAMYGPQTGNRAATFFFYLTTVTRGGETILPRANGARHPSNYTRCDQGLRVMPKKGAALLFYDMRPDLMLDEYSLHGGCPVKEGIKWSAPQWLRTRGKWDNQHGRQGLPNPGGPFHP